MSGGGKDREFIFGKVREGLVSVTPRSFPMPDVAGASFRSAGGEEEEIDLLLREVGNMGGQTRRIRVRDELVTALAELV